jgi:hypothetical protein
MSLESLYLLVLAIRAKHLAVTSNRSKHKALAFTDEERGSTKHVTHTFSGYTFKGSK